MTHKINILYLANGNAISDFKAKSVAKSLILIARTRKSTTVCYSTKNVIEELLLLEDAGKIQDIKLCL